MRIQSPSKISWLSSWRRGLSRVGVVAVLGALACLAGCAAPVSVAVAPQEVAQPVTIQLTSVGDVIKTSPLPVLVHFSMVGSRACAKVAPAIERLEAARAKDLRIVHIDVDENPELALRYNVTAVPQLLLYNHGELVSRPIATPDPTQIGHQIDLALRDSRH